MALSNAPPTTSLSLSSSTTAPSSSNNTQLAPSTTTPAETLEDPVFGPLQKAGKVVDERLLRDEQWIGVGDRLGFGASYDYVPPPNSAWAPFQKRRTVSLPDRLFDEYNSTAHCTMGLLPEIERSWVTIDNRLLLWDWADGSSFSTFDELTEVIVGVGIVKPRAGVFVDSITHLLVLSTTSQIHLVGLGYAPLSPNVKPEVTFYLTGLSVPTEGLPFTKIRGTSLGRIFLATSPDPVTPGGPEGDGCLYEIAYQSSEGWFVKRCTLHNLTQGSITQSVIPSFLRSLSAINAKEWIISLEVDNERGLLYTLLRNGTIEMYELPSSNPPTVRFDGQPNRVAKTGDVVRIAKEMCKSPALEASGFKIVSLEVIGVKEGEKDKVGLVAVTNTGVRLYFTHQRRFPSYSISARSLELFHVRPPPFSQPQQPQITATPSNSYYGQPTNALAPSSLAPPNTAEYAFKSVIQAKYSSGGLLLAANNRTEEIGVLFLSAPDNSSQASIQQHGPPQSSQPISTNVARFAEIAGTIEIGGQTWAMAEITPRGVLGEVAGRTGLNELATQVTLPRREWVVLTDMGANVVARQRPVDTLLEVLEGASLNGNGANGDVGIFFNAYGLNQSCAMLLTIAAGNSRLDGSASFNGNGGNASRNAALASEHAKSLFFEHGGRPVAVDRGGFSSTAPGSTPGGTVIFSGRHEGLAFYLARLLRPIWTQKITKLAPTPTSKALQVANVSDAVLTSVQRDLVSLRSFIEQEQQLFSLPPDTHRSAPHISHAYLTEQTSLTSLRLLLIQSVEAISFVLLLIDYQISDIIAACDGETQTKLLELRYMELLITPKGRDVARGLVSAVINQQIGRQLSVDAISDTLQQRCGSFCSADDVLLYKAIESIRRAKDTLDGAERTDCLRESLRLFIKAAKHLSFDRMKEVCAEYTALRYPLGAIDLAIACAHEWDPSDRAVSYWLDDKPANDARQAVYELRTKCNSLVFDALTATDEALNAVSNPGRANAPGAPSYADIDGMRNNAYNKALSVKDEFFHVELYDWYLARGMTDQLLETRTPYLEAYLSREPATLEKSDLLWQYYVRTSRYPDAAHILSILAETSAFPLSIHKRVEYLSLAVGNAKSQQPSSRGDTVQFLTDVEEKLEVAQVQIEIYRAIEDLDIDEKKDWLDKVEDRLFTISELYSEFAEPLELLEIILLIFHVSDHRDPILVEATWEAILARVEEDASSPIDALTAKVTELGRRFHSSDVAFPLATLIATLEERSYHRYSDEALPGWVPLALHDAGVPWDAIFTVYDELLSGELPPWNNPTGFTFLATDATVLLESWLIEASSSNSYSIQQTSSSLFPATEVDTALGKWLMSLASVQGATGVVARLNEIHREVRRRF